jgi:DNA-directed RNA polymerase specialized sigma24 family protein
VVTANNGRQLQGLPEKSILDPPVSDQDLISATRDGSDVAYRELWRRHSGAGLTAATDLSWVAKPDELVAEAFAAILVTLHSGQGPTSQFRPYLYTVIQSLASNRAARRAALFDNSLRPPAYEDPPDAELLIGG